MAHKKPSKYAGKTILIKTSSEHHQVPKFGGSEFRVEDWWDRLGQGNWMDCNGNMACCIYAMRVGFNNLPTDDEVVYGKLGSFGHLLHVSEIEKVA